MHQFDADIEAMFLILKKKIKVRTYDPNNNVDSTV
jgi:hypothetical protein